MWVVESTEQVTGSQTGSRRAVFADLDDFGRNRGNEECHRCEKHSVVVDWWLVNLWQTQYATIKRERAQIVVLVVPASRYDQNG